MGCPVFHDASLAYYLHKSFVGVNQKHYLRRSVQKVTTVHRGLGDFKHRGELHTSKSWGLKNYPHSCPFLSLKRQHMPTYT